MAKNNNTTIIEQISNQATEQAMGMMGTMAVMFIAFKAAEAIVEGVEYAGREIKSKAKFEAAMFRSNVACPIEMYRYKKAKKAAASN